MTKYWIRTTVILYILWLILSGRFEAKFLIIGLVSAAVIARICLHSLWILDRDGSRVFSLLDISIWKFIKYLSWLFIEITKSSIEVAIAVISPNMDINPQIIEFDCWYKNPIATTTLINSIIVTPGTVTLDVIDERHFVVHALTDGAAGGLLEGTMQRKIAELYNE